MTYDLDLQTSCQNALLLDWLGKKDLLWPLLQEHIVPQQQDELLLHCILQQPQLIHPPSSNLVSALLWVAEQGSSEDRKHKAGVLLLQVYRAGVYDPRRQMASRRVLM